MSIAVTCPGCDKTMKVKDEFAGKRALCPFCKAMIRVPEQDTPSEPPARDFSMVEDAEPDRQVEPRRRSRRDDQPRKRPRLRDEDNDVRRPRSGGGISSGVLTGILMMVGAVIWFFGALALNWIAFYPPVLFIVGLITFIKGLTGQED